MAKDAVSIALQFLKFRPRTIFEVKEKLRSKKLEDKEINDTIRVLKSNKLLDDSKFAKMYVRDRNLLKPTGSYLLRLELRRLGISETEIENVLKDQDEEELAIRAIESKSRYRNADFKKKASFLQRRGFSNSIIFKILNQKS